MTARATKISDPDKYGVCSHKYPFPVRDHHVHYLDQIQLDPDHEMRDRFTKDLRKLSYKYSFDYCLNPRIFAFLITWQRMGSFIIDEEDPVTDEILDFVRDLARKEVALSTDPIPKGSILGAALIALGLDTEYTLTDNTVKE
jgi:hypothetical protein